MDKNFIREGIMFKKYAKNFLENEAISASLGQLPGASGFEPLISEEEASLEEPETIIGEGVSITGTLAFQRMIRIDGSFEGEMVSEGKLIVGPKGFVKAELNLQEAFISGKVEGDIHVKERLVLRGRAEIRGDITAAALSVDEGVSIMGKVHVVPKVEESPLPQEDLSF